jgi:taurine dioxygenase
MLRFNHIVPFGVEVDVDLCRCTQDDDNALRLLFLKHHMLVFRDQALTKDEQVDFMSLFDPPLRSSREGVGYVTNDQGPENVLGTSELAFHSDLSFSPKPFDAISLHAVEVENGRSSTRFVDSTQAYLRLPDETKARIEGLHALQVFGGPNPGGRNVEGISYDLPRHGHPLVMTHPRTSETILYVNYNQTARITELDEAESDALIERLFACVVMRRRQSTNMFGSMGT